MFKYILAATLALSNFQAFASNSQLRDIKSNPKYIELSYEVVLPKSASKVDFLVVVDNSASMEFHSKGILRLAGDFSSQLEARADLDFHVGVIAGAPNFNESSPLVGTTKVVTRQTADFKSVIARNFAVGFNGSGTEEPLRAITNALSPEMLSTANLGFIREDADLVVILITDSGDSSAYTPNQTLTTLKLLKGSQNVYVTGLVDKKDANHEEYREKVELFVAVGNGLYLDIYEDTFDSTFSALPVASNTNPNITATLPVVPNDLNSVEVNFGSISIPFGVLKTGWFYDASLNQILFGEKVDWRSQPSGTLLKIRFKL